MPILDPLTILRQQPIKLWVSAENVSHRCANSFRRRVPALNRLVRAMHSSVTIAARTPMAKQIVLRDRQFWILSEPAGSGWKASVVEVKGAGVHDAVGIEATAETRGAADDAAERKLRRLLQG
jgi:hypothetical protein